ncbi:MAG: RNA-binding cell elongation regulator Jag/EloR [Chloroflexota bacterium]
MMDENQHTFIEVIAPTVEEAVTKGLLELGLSRDAVDIDILDKGRRGILGIMGTRQVRVRLLIKPTSQAQPISIEPAVESNKPQISEVISHPEEDEESLLSMAHETIATILKNLSIRANVDASFIDKPGETNLNEANPVTRRVLNLNITGQDLSILIGRQAETLQALQFITSLIINKKAGRAVPLTVDVEGYRERRKNQLSQIADRMADQAVRSGRRQVLEPMSAEDRRLIHLELRNHPNVFTESVGDEPRRKVTIVPK